MNLNYPSNSLVFYTYLSKIMLMEPVDMSDTIDKVLFLEETEAFAPNFDMLGY